MPENLRSARTPRAEFITLFDTGDLIGMKSCEKLTEEQQRPLNEIILSMWEKLSKEEKARIVREEMMYGSL